MALPPAKYLSGIRKLRLRNGIPVVGGAAGPVTARWGTLLLVKTLAAGAGPDAVSGMLWVAGILLLVGLLALLISKRGRQPDGRKRDAED
jgi:hypothetical protein